MHNTLKRKTVRYGVPVLDDRNGAGGCTGSPLDGKGDWGVLEESIEATLLDFCTAVQYLHNVDIRRNEKLRELFERNCGTKNVSQHFAYGVRLCRYACGAEAVA